MLGKVDRYWPLKLVTVASAVVSTLVAGKAPAEPAIRLPALRFKPPVKVLAPDRVRALAPFLVSPPATLAPIVGVPRVTAVVGAYRPPDSVTVGAEVYPTPGLVIVKPVRTPPATMATAVAPDPPPPVMRTTGAPT